MLPSVLLLCCILTGAFSSSSTVRVDTDFNSRIGKGTPELYGTVDTNLIPVTNNAYFRSTMANMGLGFVKVVDPDNTLKWTDSTNKGWNATLVSNYFTAMDAAYKGRNVSYIMAIKRWPAWMSSATTLPLNLHANYSRHVADLVKIINIDLGRNISHWQPFHNIDSGYTSKLSELYALYNVCAVAMKAVDPSIKIGPSLSSSSPSMSLALLKNTTGVVDFVQLHLYLTPNLGSRTTSDIFSPDGSMQTRIQAFMDSIRTEFPTIPFILDEYALHYNSSLVDVRVQNYIGAVWYAQMHIMFGIVGVAAATNYNIRSNYIGLLDTSNNLRVATDMFRWSNNYLIGDIYTTTSTYSFLQTTTIRRPTDNFTVLCLVNTGPTDVQFVINNVASYGNGTFISNIINSTGTFENMLLSEWQFPNFGGLHIIQAYSVLLLYNNGTFFAPPPTVAPTIPATPKPNVTYTTSTGNWTTGNSTGNSTTGGRGNSTTSGGSSTSTSGGSTSGFDGSTSGSPSRPVAKLRLSITVMDTFDRPRFISSIATDLQILETDVSVTSAILTSSSRRRSQHRARQALENTYDVRFQISADDDTTVTYSVDLLANVINNPNSTLAQSGFTPIPGSFVVESVVLTGTTTLYTPSSSSTSTGLEAGGSSGKSKSGANTAVLVGIIVPVAVVFAAAVAVGVFLMQRQRRAVVEALLQTEEGERRAYKIDFSALETLNLLGSGSFGHVYKGEYRGTHVAIKKLKHQNMSKQQLDEFAREAAVMVGLRHPNIVLFMGVCLEPANLCIISELMSRGSLYDVINETKVELSFSLKVRMALDALRGLQFLHSAGFVHRDLKSPNLLVDKSWNIKIADFGLSCGKGTANENVQVSLLWTAPEVLTNSQYSEKSDVYSMAIILWELMAGKLPFEGVAPAAIHNSVVSGCRPFLSEDWDPKIKKAMEDGWLTNPQERADVKQIRSLLESIPINENDTPSNDAAAGGNSANRGRQPIPKPPFTLVCVEIEHEAELWQRNPADMVKALKTYKEVIWTHVKRIKPFILPTQDDSWIFAFADAVTATNFSLRVQMDLLRADWDLSLSTEPLTQEKWDTEGLLYKGIRARMGIHFGAPIIMEVENEPTTFAGPVMQDLLHLTRSAGGGQILLTGDAYTTMSEMERLDPYIINTVGTAKLKSKAAMNLYEIVPKTLKGRLGVISDHLRKIQSGAVVSDSDITPASQKWIIPFDDLNIGELLGVGASGDVLRGTFRSQPVAIKQFLKQKIDPDTLLDMRAESATLSTLQHPHILKFYGMCLKPGNISLVTELMIRGSLANVIHKQNESPPWNLRLQMVNHIANGLHFLHQKNILHRDFKSSNIFLDKEWCAKVGDFGFARMKAENQTMTQLGTVAWTSPEIFDGAPYSEKSDIFGFAVIVWEIVFAKQPWEGVHTMKVINSVCSGKRLSLTPFPSEAPPVLLKLIASCWEHEPENRPSSAEIVRLLQQG